MVTQLQGIKTILETPAVELSSVKRGVEVVNDTVKSLGCKITEAGSRISGKNAEWEKPYFLDEV